QVDYASRVRRPTVIRAVQSPSVMALRSAIDFVREGIGDQIGADEVELAEANFGGPKGVVAGLRATLGRRGRRAGWARSGRRGRRTEDSGQHQQPRHRTTTG